MDKAQVDKLMVRTAEYGVLKINVHCMEMPYTLKDSFLV
jgi:hypothetical protein